MILGERIVEIFSVRSLQGERVDADLLPVGAVYVDGVEDVEINVAVEKLDVGRYRATTDVIASLHSYVELIVSTQVFGREDQEILFSGWVTAQ